MISKLSLLTMKLIIKHFEHYRKLKPWPFCWRITLEGFLIILPFGFIMTFFFDISNQRPEISTLYDHSVIFILFSAGVIFPIIETLFLQAFPVFFVRLFNASFITQLIASWIPFALMHFFANISVGICAGLIRGFYFGFTYTHWRQHSRWVAFWTTSVSHILNNFVLISLILLINYILISY